MCARFSGCFKGRLKTGVSFTFVISLRKSATLPPRRRESFFGFDCRRFQPRVL
ncbi:hypothetical protein HMPREF9120_02496 [Neisseria sp. oral taxon 020 str. F0370]|nr:hypothetical protein HMPREF9120_02496 [Neisseria sp. oral taxon 020 str. F0370]